MLIKLFLVVEKLPFETSSVVIEVAMFELAGKDNTVAGITANFSLCATRLTCFADFLLDPLTAGVPDTCELLFSMMH